MLSKDSWHCIAKITISVVSNNMFSFLSKCCQLCLHVCVSTSSLSKALWFFCYVSFTLCPLTKVSPFFSGNCYSSTPLMILRFVSLYFCCSDNKNLNSTHLQFWSLAVHKKLAWIVLPSGGFCDRISFFACQLSALPLFLAYSLFSLGSNFLVFLL